MQKHSVFKFWDFILGLQLWHLKCSFLSITCKVTKQGTEASLELIDFQVLQHNFEQIQDQEMLWLLLSPLFDLRMLNPGD